MIDFSLTENQIAVRDMARDVAAKVVKPNIQEFDRRAGPAVHVGAGEIRWAGNGLHFTGTGLGGDGIR